MGGINPGKMKLFACVRLGVVGSISLHAKLMNFSVDSPYKNDVCEVNIMLI